MLAEEAEVFRDATFPAASIKVGVDNFDSICKAAVSHIEHEHESEKPDPFVNKNPAARKLDQLVSETYDAMAFSMLKEISDALNGD
jgi:hypothetical protein